MSEQELLQPPDLTPRRVLKHVLSPSVSETGQAERGVPEGSTTVRRHAVPR